MSDSASLNLYRSILRPILFSGLNADPEWLHQQTLAALEWLDVRSPLAVRTLILNQLTQLYGDHGQPKDAKTDSRPNSKLDRLAQTCFGCHFDNPLGLAAGFDKNGQGMGVWSNFGFGFAELGTVTQYGQTGNPQPRLFRLVDDQAALNRMGFNNAGSEALRDRLEARRTMSDRTLSSMPVGINLGKSKITPLEDAAEDYRVSFQRLKHLGDYFVVNVSSPNTPGLRSLQSVEQLHPIFEALAQENTDQKPIFVKIAPDLLDDDILAVVDLARSARLTGIIATNTTIRRDGLKTQVLARTGNRVADEAGGISGAPVRSRSTEVIALIARHTQGEFPIIGVGGISTAADAWEKITAGACLLQVYTGWIYEGPALVRQILSGLVDRLDQAGLDTIDQAIGLSNRR